MRSWRTALSGAFLLIVVAGCSDGSSEGGLSPYQRGLTTVPATRTAEVLAATTTLEAATSPGSLMLATREAELASYRPLERDYIQALGFAPGSLQTVGLQRHFPSYSIVWSLASQFGDIQPTRASFVEFVSTHTPVPSGLKDVAGEQIARIAHLLAGKNPPAWTIPIGLPIEDDEVDIACALAEATVIRSPLVSEGFVPSCRGTYDAWLYDRFATGEPSKTFPEYYALQLDPGPPDRDNICSSPALAQFWPPEFCENSHD